MKQLEDTLKVLEELQVSAMKGLEEASKMLDQVEDLDKRKYLTEIIELCKKGEATTAHIPVLLEKLK